MRPFSCFLSLAFLALLFTACSSDDPKPDPGEEPGPCGYSFLPGDKCDEEGDSSTCDGLAEKEACILEACNDGCTEACLSYQRAGESGFCLTGDGPGSECRSDRFFFCPCKDTPMALTPWTATCDDDVIGDPVCDFVVDISGEECGDDFGDGFDCSHWDFKKDCLLNHAAEACADGEVTLLSLGTQWECTNDEGEKDCVYAGYVYCKCPDGDLPPGVPAYPEEDCELPPDPDPEPADAGHSEDAGEADAGEEDGGAPDAGTLESDTDHATD